MLTIAEKKSQFSGDDEIAEAVGRSFDRAFSRQGANRKTVLSTFEATLEGLRKAKNPEMKLRGIAKSVTLATGRCHGNVVDTGRCLLDQLESLSQKYGFKEEMARDQMLLGLAEGACQLGPIAYCRFLDVACTYREDADEWIGRNRRLPAVFEGEPLPVIVPYENELTIQPTTPEPAPQVEVCQEQKITPAPSNDSEWTSSPKRRTFFRRLSDAVGYWFGS